MKKIIGLLLMAGVLLCAFCGCGEKLSESIETETESFTDETVTEIEKDAIISEAETKDEFEYNYIVEALQGVDYCSYSKINNNITAKTVCPTCGKEGYGCLIEIKDLDFSQRDKAMYFGSERCHDCYWERSIPSYMLAISITREKVEK